MDKLGQFIIDILMKLPALVNWLICRLIDLVLAVWPSSSTLGIPNVVTLINDAQTQFSFFPWFLFNDVFACAILYLGAILIVKAIKIIWP
ncbi:MAG TPA: hypothetical protein V6C97_26445 [Oculatellaceae cyanobacterium]